MAPVFQLFLNFLSVGFLFDMSSLERVLLKVLRCLSLASFSPSFVNLWELLLLFRNLYNIIVLLQFLRIPLAYYSIIVKLFDEL